MNDIKISIILSGYSNDIFACRTLETLETQLENSTELLITADGTDAMDARNKGIEMARGEFICFLDCHDCIKKNGIRTLLDNLKEPADVYIYGTALVKNSEKDWYCSVSDFSDEYVRNSEPVFFRQCTMLYRKEIIISNNLRFGAGYSFEEEWLFFASYLKFCSYVMVSSDEVHLSNDLKTLQPQEKAQDFFNTITALNSRIADVILHLCKEVTSEEKTYFKRKCFADCIMHTVNRFAEHPGEKTENLPIINSLAFGPSGMSLWEGKKNVCTADVLIVLGCTYCETRIEAAIDYGRHNPNMFYLVTGGNSSCDNKHSEAEYMKYYLLEKGMCSEKIIVENSATNTVSNLHKSFNLISELLKQGKLKAEEIGIVTEAFHENYVLQCIRKYGFDKQFSIKMYVCFGQYATPDTWYENETARRNILYNISRTFIAEEE